MLRAINELKGYIVEATDGEVGPVVEFYFDDENWTVRYLIVDTGSWLVGRKVLVSPSALGDVDWDSRKLRVNLTRERVENSPGIDTDKPVSRQHEMDYSDYYGYPYYWGGPFLWGPVAYPSGYRGTYTPERPRTVEKELEAAKRQQENIHLRSTKEVSGYDIEASDGEIGHVEDFLVDDETWTIRYFIVDTRNWWPGKKVLVSPQWIRGVSWTDQRVRVDLSRDAIKNAPEYDEHARPNREYERRLHEHHGQPHYWEG